MDLLHSGRFEGFCLVSSDGDFTRLATRIREDGLRVFGYGRKDAAKAFVNACERYIYIENLLAPPETARDAATPPLPEPVTLPASKSATIHEPVKPAPLKSASQAEVERLKKLLARAYTNVADENGWALVSRVDQYLRANHSDFDPRNYGASTFPKLLAGFDIFELIQRQQGNGKAQFCRLRKAQAKPEKTKKASNTVNVRLPLPATYIEALKTAVATSQSSDGWSRIGDIRNYLHQHGHRLEDSGCERLDEAIKASGLFDMRDSGGTSKDFRLARSGDD
jgi:hypothetical protein